MREEGREERKCGGEIKREREEEYRERREKKNKIKNKNQIY